MVRLLETVYLQSPPAATSGSLGGSLTENAAITRVSVAITSHCLMVCYTWVECTHGFGRTHTGTSSEARTQVQAQKTAGTLRCRSQRNRTQDYSRKGSPRQPARDVRAAVTCCAAIRYRTLCGLRPRGIGPVLAASASAGCPVPCAKLFGHSQTRKPLPSITRFPHQGRKFGAVRFRNPSGLISRRLLDFLPSLLLTSSRSR